MEYRGKTTKFFGCCLVPLCINQCFRELCRKILQIFLIDRAGIKVLKRYSAFTLTFTFSLDESVWFCPKRNIDFFLFCFLLLYTGCFLVVLCCLVFFFLSCLWDLKFSENLQTSLPDWFLIVADTCQYLLVSHLSLCEEYTEA